MELKNYFAQDDKGDALPKAQCYVYQRGSETLVNGLVKANGVAQANPFEAANDGLIQFAAPNGLYDLRVVHGARDYRIQVQFNDVSDSVSAAERAANDAENAADAAQLTGGVFATVADGMAATVQGRYFSVPSAEVAESLVLYRNDAGTATKIKVYPSTQALKVLTDLLWSANDSEDYLRVTDDEGGVHLEASAQRFKAEFFELKTGTGFGFMDDEGGVPIYADAEKAYLGPLEVRYIDYPGVVVGNEDGEIIEVIGAEPTAAISALDQELLFAPVIAVAESSPSTIYPMSILSEREQIDQLTANVFSQTTIASSSGTALTVSAAYGADAALTLRQKGASDLRATLPLQIKVAPQQSSPKPLTVLFVGDSIGNNQGAMFLKEYLEAMGYAPSFIGTVHGAAITSRYDTGGPLGEARSGWQLADYVFSKADRALIVAPGAESVYLSMEKVDQLTYNPFLRAATSEDDPSVVQNGYVFDLTFYQSRFGLPAPDVVINALGTNDATSQPVSGFYDLCLANDLLFNKQVSKAWPNARIIRTVPATGIDSARSAVWKNMYTHMIRAMRDAAAANSKVTVAPLWAMMNPDLGFPVPTTHPGADGFMRGTWSDPVHPSGASRREYYKAMAPFVAVAALNI